MQDSCDDHVDDLAVVAASLGLQVRQDEAARTAEDSDRYKIVKHATTCSSSNVYDNHNLPKYVIQSGTGVGGHEEYSCVSSITSIPFQQEILYPSTSGLVRSVVAEEESKQQQQEDLDEEKSAVPPSFLDLPGSTTDAAVVQKSSLKVLEASVLAKKTINSSAAIVTDDAERALYTLAADLSKKTYARTTTAVEGDGGTSTTPANRGGLLDTATVESQATGHPGAFVILGDTHPPLSNACSNQQHSNGIIHREFIPESSTGTSETEVQFTEETRSPELIQQEWQRLARARSIVGPVVDGQEGGILPVAHPVDARTKRAIAYERQPRCWLASGLILPIFCSLIVLVIVVVAIVVVEGNNNSEEELRRSAIREKIQKAFISDDSIAQVDREDSPYSKAMEWIIVDDPMQLDSTNYNLLQRYYLALFYFSTTLNEENEWKDCNPPDLSIAGNVDNDSGRSQLCYHETLMSSFHEGLLGGTFSEGGGINYYGDKYISYEEVLATRWLTGAHECQWAGLFCNEHRRVTHLHLEHMNLKGTIPPELGMVESLSSIALPYNNLHGSIPPGISRLTDLIYIDLQDNQLTSVAMDSWSILAKLSFFRIAYNPFAPWPIPANLPLLMPNLNAFLAQAASLTGSVPSRIANLSTLRELSLAGNYDVIGTIPTELFLLTKLQGLFLSYTLLSGSIPTEIAQLSKLTHLDLFETVLSGTIPEQLYSGDFNDLFVLDLGANLFSGTISKNLSRLWFLGFLYFDTNPKMVGVIPTEIGLLEGLQKFHLHGSSFTGSIPAELCDLRNKYLNVLKADCFIDSATGEIPLKCDQGCCTKCCDRETGYCENLLE